MKPGGICKIGDGVARPTGQDNDTYISKSGENIGFEKIKCFEIEPEECILEIPGNKLNHEGICTCGNRHLCGTPCIQCGYLCTKYYDEEHELHSTTHGNIKNAYIYISNKKDNSYANIRKDGKNYKLVEGEKLTIFFCNKYCSEQGQGHTHLFKSDKTIDTYNNEDVQIVDSTENIYECKCQYYWKNVLKFYSGHTSAEEKNFWLM